MLKCTVIRLCRFTQYIITPYAVFPFQNEKVLNSFLKSVNKTGKHWLICVAENEGTEDNVYFLFLHMIPQVFVYCTSWRKRQLKFLRLHSHNKYILVKRLRKRKTRVQQVEALFPSILLENQTAPVWLTEQRQSWEPGLFHFPVNTLPSLLLHPAPAVQGWKLRAALRRLSTHAGQQLTSHWTQREANKLRARRTVAFR